MQDAMESGGRELVKAIESVVVVGRELKVAIIA